MYFEVKVNQTPYKLIVEENRINWIVKIQSETLKGQTWEEYVISKNDFSVTKDGNISLLYKNVSYIIDIIKYGTDYEVYTRGSHRNISIVNDEILLRESIRGGGGLGGQENLKAGMPGKIVKIFVQEGQEVQSNDPLVIIEAMKMENEIRATHNCTIDRIFVTEGENVETSAPLIAFK